MGMRGGRRAAERLAQQPAVLGLGRNTEVKHSQGGLNQAAIWEPFGRELIASELLLRCNEGFLMGIAKKGDNVGRAAKHNCESGILLTVVQTKHKLGSLSVIWALNSRTHNESTFWQWGVQRHKDGWEGSNTQWKGNPEFDSGTAIKSNGLTLVARQGSHRGWSCWSKSEGVE